MMAWFLQLTGISTLGIGLLFVLVALPGTEPPGRCALGGWNPAMTEAPRTVRVVDNLRFILMFLVMTGILMLWR